MHDKLLKHLKNVADVYLVTRLKNRRLGFPFKDDMRIFIPDVHLISKARNEVFKYGTNHPKLLSQLAEVLKNFKTEVSEGKTVVVYQLGDFMDLWRETPAYWSIGGISDEWEASVQQILDDNSSIINRLRGRALSTQFVLGNHDIDLRWLPTFSQWKLRFYFPFDPSNPEKKIRAVALHGDIFSVFEKKTPDWLQYLAVYLFGAAKNPDVKDLNRWRKEVIKTHNKRKYLTYLQQSTPMSLDNLILIKSDPLPERHNIREKGTSDEKELKYLKEAEDFSFKINEDMRWDLRMAVIGHTHHARIAVDETDEQFFALIDCGAWIERCKGVVDHTESEMDSAQIGVLCDNDVRIYQLSPKTT